MGIFDLLGFTTVENSIWNAISYGAFVAIIIGVFSERFRNILITLGAVVLAIYAEVFLKNPLFATLQTLIVVSGLLQIANLRRHFVVIAMMALTIVAYLFLFLSGVIADGWVLAGSFGLLGIAFGLVTLPNRFGFLLMASGGVLLIIYAFRVGAWVFFLLNIFFIIANLYTWQKTRGVSA
ncbi:MAG TPA: hypothetical protein VJC20_00795 [Candidatus Paceibacterota bacterium]